jgi:cytoskeleton protein RodZ
MSESLATPTGDTAGAMLRQARTAQGMHIAALAATIKVPLRKLESLEADRYDELPDAAFARALAKTMCRVLKIDADPVLAKLPQPQALKLEGVSRGLGQPLHTPTAVPAADFDLAGLLGHPAAWGPALILVAALALWMLPEGMFQRRPAQEVREGTDPGVVVSTAPVPVAPASAASEPQPGAVVASAGSASAVPPGQAPGVELAAPAAAVAAGTAAGSTAPAARETVHGSPDSAAAGSGTGDVRIRTTAPSWIGVVDGQGQTLLHRTVQPGESVDLSGTTPLKIRVGNVAATQLSFRGQPVDLNPSAKGNIARLELQ